MSRTSLSSKILSVIVSIVMVVSLTPMAWADEPDVPAVESELVVANPDEGASSVADAVDPAGSVDEDFELGGGGRL